MFHLPNSPRPRAARRNRSGILRFEKLDDRRMMAGDAAVIASFAPQPMVALVSPASSFAPATRVAQGEPGIDLVQFAKDLGAAGVIYYGAPWCPACTQQSQLFEDGDSFLPFIDVTLPDRTLAPQFAPLNITQFPTWDFGPASEDFNGDGIVNQDDGRLVGVQTLETISQRAGVPIPSNVGENPFFAPIGDKTVQLGSPLHVSVDGYDPEGGPLTVTVSVGDPDLLEAVVLSGNRSLRLDMDGFGDMVFQLFDDRAPRAAGRVATLAESGFYDGIIFHRVVNGFVIQAGDPTGTGTSGSTLGNFDDEFHPDLQHTGKGVLSFAKAGDDTNNSQFFITEVPTQSLDFNHSIFGQLVEGDDVREAISNMAVAPGNNRPLTDIRINNASVFIDTENAVVMLKAKAGAGSTTVTYTITDAQGNSFSETTTVTLGPDIANAQPYLNPIAPPIPAISGSIVSIQLSSVDLENDPVRYLLDSNSPAIGGQFNSETGLLQIQSASDFVGPATVFVAVQAANNQTEFDAQAIPFTFISPAQATPNLLDLLPTSDTGTTDDDNITSASTLRLRIDGVVTGGQIEIIDVTTGEIVGTATATGTSVETAISNPLLGMTGTLQLAARQRLHSATSPASPVLNLTITRPQPFHDPIDRFNVNRRDGVGALDALLIINVLNAFSGEVSTLDPPPPGLELDFVYDVSGDGRISALDALQVINELNRLSSQGEPIGRDVVGLDLTRRDETARAAIDEAIAGLF